MADDDEHLTIDERVDRSARQRLANVVLLSVLLVVLAGWASLGAFQLEPGQSAVLLQFGPDTARNDVADLIVGWLQNHEG